MKNAFAAIVAVGLILAPTAAGGVPDPEYGGKVDGKKNRYLGFDTGGGKVKEIFVQNIPFSDCDDPKDDGKQGGELEAKFPIAGSGKFGGTETDDFNIRGDATGIRYTMKGEIDGPKADGTLEMKILGTNCKSGKVEWKASKPAPPPPDTESR